MQMLVRDGRKRFRGRAGRCYRFWDRVIARFVIVRFVIERAFAISLLELGILMLAATRTGMVDHILSRW